MHVGRDRPVLEEVGAVVEDPAEAPFVDHLLDQPDGGHSAVVVPDRVGNLGILDRLHHRLPFDQVHRKGLLAEDHLARLRRGDRDLGVAVVGSADIDRVDVLAGDELPPVGLDGFVTPLLGEGAGARLVAAADGLEHRAIREVEEVVHTLVAIGVRPAHEAVTHQADVQRFLRCHESTWSRGNGARWAVPTLRTQGSIDADHACQPLASRTAIIAARMSFQVSGLLITALGNMQPSQQM